jgi:hypothetical protein
MTRRFSIAAFSVFAGSLAAASVALAQGYPANFAQRCAPDEVRVVPSPRDPCEPQIALFGLKGPTVVGRPALDVETTGSVEPNRAEPKGGDSTR